jgi:hypothetical protein
MLKFNCKNCGWEIIVKYLKPGEMSKCRNCNTENEIPDNALETDELPEYMEAPWKKPVTTKTKGLLNPDPISVKHWFIILLLANIPLVNLIGIIFCAVSNDVNMNLRNLCRAALIWFIVGAILVGIIILVDVFGFIGV